MLRCEHISTCGNAGVRQCRCLVTQSSSCTAVMLVAQSRFGMMASGDMLIERLVAEASKLVMMQCCSTAGCLQEPRLQNMLSPSHALYSGYPHGSQLNRMRAEELSPCSILSGLSSCRPNACRDVWLLEDESCLRIAVCIGTGSCPFMAHKSWSNPPLNFCLNI